LIKPWIFEFMQAPAPDDGTSLSGAITAAYNEGYAFWLEAERLGFEGIFFSEHHFGLSLSPSPNLLIASIARQTTRLRLGTMGLVVPFYQPWRVLEELAMLDHLTNGRLEIGFAAGVPQELARIGLAMEEARERFNEALEILDAALVNRLRAEIGATAIQDLHRLRIRHAHIGNLRRVSDRVQPTRTGGGSRSVRHPAQYLHFTRCRRGAGGSRGREGGDPESRGWRPARQSRHILVARCPESRRRILAA
jgi:alkanesulfonate monooxygenase SsuD/methylene tetrahydromethanopterin reductase-like flavin-dependent oxidoreductase (luciferase family)